MLLHKPKNNNNTNNNDNINNRRFLITVTVLGSAGPIRFVVNENDLVDSVIDTALRSYAREGRLPILGSDINSFVLYCPVARTEALNPWDKIGSVGVRNFTLCKKTKTEDVSVDTAEKPCGMSSSSKGANILKAWLHKTCSVKISSH